MGKGIDAARSIAPEHAQAMDDLKDQLLIVFLKRLGGDVTLPVSEIDDTGMNVLSMEFCPERRTFRFVIGSKQ